jgi:hypothetical protein
VENQRWLERIDSLKDTPAAVRFVSFEPLLEDVGALVLDGIQWCIVGGESGPGARPFHISWARSIVAECKRQNVAVFVKQLGSRAMDYFDHHEWPSGTRAHVGATMQDLNWIQLRPPRVAKRDTRACRRNDAGFELDSTHEEGRRHGRVAGRFTRARNASTTNNRN